MSEHDLKTWPEFFDAVEAGRKTFEVRKNDRDYQVGDRLILRRFDPNLQIFSDHEPIRKTVVYMLRGGAWGIAPDHCVLGLA